MPDPTQDPNHAQSAPAAEDSILAASLFVTVGAELPETPREVLINSGTVLATVAGPGLEAVMPPHEAAASEAAPEPPAPKVNLPAPLAAAFARSARDLAVRTEALYSAAIAGGDISAEDAVRIVQEANRYEYTPVGALRLYQRTASTALVCTAIEDAKRFGITPARAVDEITRVAQVERFPDATERDPRLLRHIGDEIRQGTTETWEELRNAYHAASAAVRKLGFTLDMEFGEVMERLYPLTRSADEFETVLRDIATTPLTPEERRSDEPFADRLEAVCTRIREEGGLDFEPSRMLLGRQDNFPRTDDEREMHDYACEIEREEGEEP